MTDMQTLDMPVRRFWAMYDMISVIESETSLSLIEVNTTAQSEESYEQVTRKLGTHVESAFEVEIDIEPKRDPNYREKLNAAMGK